MASPSAPFALALSIQAYSRPPSRDLISLMNCGLAVTIGARIAGKAGGSEILVSQTVKDLVAGSGLAFVDAGEHELKGIPGSWRLYRTGAG